ncbi:hypothetical protein DXD15_03185 [Blautia sp. TF11-31AT]|nr:hypothetical protein DXD15_03185 [Blautia sp. TF11-31AT]
MLLWLIFRRSHPNFLNVRTAYASEILAQLTKNHLTKSGTERFREYIIETGGVYDYVGKCKQILRQRPAGFKRRITAH